MKSLRGDMFWRPCFVRLSRSGCCSVILLIEVLLSFVEEISL